MHPILKLEEVYKIYGDHVAVDHLTFNIPAGSIFGMLGPNGAGKTSLIRIITTITRADSGQVYLDGELLNEKHPSQIGYMPEERGLYKKMKVGDHLMYLARLKGLSKKAAKTAINEWFEKFNIEDWWDKKIEELSKGMQQKIQFIATVVHKPKLLILDEPFSGLDPINSNLIKDEIDNLNKEGISIIFSTHRMEQVEEVCQDIVLINKGKNILQGEVAAVKNQFKENLFRIDYEGNFPTGLRETLNIKEWSDKHLVVQLESEQASNQLLRHLIDQGLLIHGFIELLPTLNEIFIRQVNNN